MPHSQTGKISPSSPLIKLASRWFFGKKRVIVREGTKAAITPETSAPTNTNGSPSKANAR